MIGADNTLRDVNKKGNSLAAQLVSAFQSVTNRRAMRDGVASGDEGSGAMDTNDQQVPLAFPHHGAGGEAPREVVVMLRGK